MNILFWGMVGLTTEVVFTAARNLIVDKKVNLIGHTSLWMFPIYALGLTYGFDFIEHCITNDVVRYISYPLWIWGVELIVGYPASKVGIRAWDYGYLPARCHWNRIISYVHFPLWIIFGIIIEVLRNYA